MAGPRVGPAGPAARLAGAVPALVAAHPRAGPPRSGPGARAASCVRDMVFVPEPALTGRLLGLGHEPPRAVPSDLVVALASHVAPGRPRPEGRAPRHPRRGRLGAARLAPRAVPAGVGGGPRRGVEPLRRGAPAHGPVGPARRVRRAAPGWCSAPPGWLGGSAVALSLALGLGARRRSAGPLPGWSSSSRRAAPSQGSRCRPLGAGGAGAGPLRSVPLAWRSRCRGRCRRCCVPPGSAATPPGSRCSRRGADSRLGAVGIAAHRGRDVERRRRAAGPGEPRRRRRGALLSSAGPWPGSPLTRRGPVREAHPRAAALRAPVLGAGLAGLVLALASPGRRCARTGRRMARWRAAP